MSTTFCNHVHLSQEQNKKLDELNRELEDSLQSNQEQLETKSSSLEQLQQQFSREQSERKQAESDRDTFQALAMEKDKRIGDLTSENKEFKMKERG